MIRMVKVKKQSVAFCKYTIASLVWLSVVLVNQNPLYFVLAIMLISAVTGIDKAPLVKLFDLTFAKKLKSTEEYINTYSMRFAHIFGSIFCAVCITLFVFDFRIIAVVLSAVFAILQSIAAFGYCSAQKLYECVVCNNNCCRFGKKVRSIKKNVR